jgi:hypothetical protein
MLATCFATWLLLLLLLLLGLKRRAVAELLLLLLEGDGVAKGREMMALSEGEGVVAEHRPIRPKFGRPGRVLPWRPGPGHVELGPINFFLLHFCE